MIKFKEIITIHWESEDGRFRITGAIPRGFCAMDHWTGGPEDCDKGFTKTLEEAKQWCQERAR